MTVLIASLVVAVAAAARGVWSPCGLSMLSTITPVGERGRGNRYATTARWFVAGSLAGGLCLGVVAAALARVVQLSADGRLAAALAASLVALASDARVGGFALPIHRRQVNERWLDRYRPWVYGGGFGWQIGTGLCTYITSAATYLVVVLAAVTGSMSVAIACGVLFGLVRGGAVLLTRRVTTPTGLQALHQDVHRRGPRLHTGVLVVETAVVVAAALGLAPWLGAVAALAGAVVLLSWPRRASSALVCDLDAGRRLDVDRVRSGA